LKNFGNHYLLDRGPDKSCAALQYRDFLHTTASVAITVPRHFSLDPLETAIQ